MHCTGKKSKWMQFSDGKKIAKVSGVCAQACPGGQAAESGKGPACLFGPQPTILYWGRVFCWLCALCQIEEIGWSWCTIDPDRW